MVSKEALFASAHELSQSGKFLEAAAQWREYGVNSSDKYWRTMELENLRLAGSLSGKDFDRKDSLEDFRNHLGSAGSEHLVVQYLRSQRSRRKIRELLRAFAFTNALERETLAWKSLRVTKQPLLDEKRGKLDFQAFITVALLRPRRISCISGIRASGSTGNVAKPRLALFRSALIFRSENSIHTSGSEAAKLSGGWLVDYATYNQARNDDYVCDSLLLGRDGRKVALRFEPKVTQRVSRAIFLAYPLSESWGHWFLECLSRLAIATDKGINISDYDLIVKADVPESFLALTEEIFGKLTFLRVESGQSVEVSECITVLSTNHQKRRFHPSKSGGKRSNIDPKPFQILRSIILQTSRRNSQQMEFGKLVHLDRVASKYRKSESERVVSRLTERTGFISIDPGTLEPSLEMSLFSNASHICAFSGSQLLLALSAPALKSILIVTHDHLDEAQGISNLFQRVLGVRPDWIAGSRKVTTHIYSERSIHQEILLDSKAISTISTWMQDANKSLMFD